MMNGIQFPFYQPTAAGHQPEKYSEIPKANPPSELEKTEEVSTQTFGKLKVLERYQAERTVLRKKRACSNLEPIPSKPKIPKTPGADSETIIYSKEELRVAKAALKKARKLKERDLKNEISHQREDKYRKDDSEEDLPLSCLEFEEAERSPPDHSTKSSDSSSDSSSESSSESEFSLSSSSNSLELEGEFLPGFAPQKEDCDKTIIDKEILDYETGYENETKEGNLDRFDEMAIHYLDNSI